MSHRFAFTDSGDDEDAFAMMIGTALQRTQRKIRRSKRRGGQYFNSSVKLSKLAFFDQICNYSKEFQLFLNKQKFKKAGILKAQKALLNFFKIKVKLLSEIISKTVVIFDNIKYKHKAPRNWHKELMSVIESQNKSNESH